MGKTTVAEKLCRHYKIHHIKINKVTEEKIAQLVSGIPESTEQANSAPLVFKKRCVLPSCGDLLHTLQGLLENKYNFSL